MNTPEMKPSFLTPTFEAHEVGGDTYNFWPVSLRVLFKLRCVATPLAKSLSTLFSVRERDTITESHDWTDVETGERGSTTKLLPASTELSEALHKRRTAAIEELVIALTERSNLLIVGEIIMDSMREDFPRNPSKEQIAAFVDDEGMNVPTISALLVGVAKANKKVFGPLADTVSASLAKVVKEKVEAMQRDLEEPDDQDAQSETKEESTI